MHKTMNIFLSRPTWISQEYQPGLDGLLRVLEGLGLKPRTLGATDYPNRAPLDEVIHLLDQCVGAMILGFPQIVATAGTIRAQTIEGEVILATEWNHIEAGLAHARGLPLLIIHHSGVRRGIFDRGAISSFIYELNLRDPAWPLCAEIQGALRTWKSNLIDPGGGLSPISDPSGKVRWAQTARASELASEEVRDTLSPISVSYCSRCGAIPGKSSSCSGWTEHKFVPWTNRVFCRRCGATPGMTSRCNGWSEHNFHAEAPELRGTP